MFQEELPEAIGISWWMRTAAVTTLDTRDIDTDSRGWDVFSLMISSLRNPYLLSPCPDVSADSPSHRWWVLLKCKLKYCGVLMVVQQPQLLQQSEPCSPGTSPVPGVWNLQGVMALLFLVALPQGFRLMWWMAKSIVSGKLNGLYCSSLLVSEMPT